MQHNNNSGSDSNHIFMCSLQAHWWAILLAILTLSGLMGCTVCLCSRTLNTRDLEWPLMSSSFILYMVIGDVPHWRHSRCHLCSKLRTVLQVTGEDTCSHLLLSDVRTSSCICRYPSLPELSNYNLRVAARVSWRGCVVESIAVVANCVQIPSQRTHILLQYTHGRSEPVLPLLRPCCCCFWTCVLMYWANLSLGS